jgi:hypothetical protein
MPKSVPSHIQGLLAYLAEPDEKANEDLVLSYFRSVFGDSFTRQRDAKRSDGYVAGHFVLELKADSKDWLGALFQGLAYRNLELDFGQIIVAAKNFLAIWQVEHIPEALRDEVLAAKGAPNSIGKVLSRKYSSRRNELLKLATWNGGVELSGSLFASQPDLIVERIKSFEGTLKAGRKVRQKITTKNFSSVLRQMTRFFEPAQPIKAVRAFYSMSYGWGETSTLQLSQKANDQATLGGEVITSLIPGMRQRFKEFVENHSISLSPDENIDDFFARFDEALDSVDKGFRIRNGIFFTDLDLSRFVMWFVKRDIPELGKNYLVIDPACGSGNLVTNWRSPLELRHKVVSEIEPELLFAVEQRMKGDQWHNGKFTVVPKVSENKGLNFLNRTAEDYLQEIKKYLVEKGHKPDKPLAFLCNPPYRSDDDQASETINYKPDSTVLAVTGADAGNERYCCFLAQMKLMCEAAESRGLPGESLLLVFTKSAWLTKRAIFDGVRTSLLGVFEDCGGILVNGSEFFDVKGKWPVAFTMWRYKGKDANLDPHRPVRLIDLTWLKKERLAKIRWDDPEVMERECREIISAPNATRVELGRDRTSIREWSGQTMLDFKRSRRKLERNQRMVGGLPLGDRRQSNKKAYGESGGQFIGFMDDLTPCRVKNSAPDRPWFRLNNQFMDFRKNRCFSGPPTHWGYCASDLVSAKKLFFWYALARTFTQHPYPMWVDADDMWEPTIPEHLDQRVSQIAFTIAYAENECLEAHFPANNPITGAAALSVNNPMTPLRADSFWSIVMNPYIGQNPCVGVKLLVGAVDKLFGIWRKLFKGRTELPILGKPYMLDSGGITVGAGITQIRDYALDEHEENLLAVLAEVQESLKSVKSDFFELLTAKTGLDYFGARAKTVSEALVLPEKTRFDKVLAKRLAIAGIFVDRLNNDPNFGRTKLAKMFYLANVHEGFDLETEYYREAAGPLDQRALYNQRIGIESAARKYRLFIPETKGQMVRYRPDRELKHVVSLASRHLGAKTEGVKRIADLFQPLTTDQSEIVATLYACWNDFLIRKRRPTDEEIVHEFVYGWHPQKARFSKRRLLKALVWMRHNNLSPRGVGKPTSTKPSTA